MAWSSDPECKCTLIKGSISSTFHHAEFVGVMSGLHCAGWARGFVVKSCSVPCLPPDSGKCYWLGKQPIHGEFFCKQTIFANGTSWCSRIYPQLTFLLNLTLKKIFLRVGRIICILLTGSPPKINRFIWVNRPKCGWKFYKSLFL